MLLGVTDGFRKPVPTDTSSILSAPIGQPTRYPSSVEYINACEAWIVKRAHSTIDKLPSHRIFPGRSENLYFLWFEIAGRRSRRAHNLPQRIISVGNCMAASARTKIFTSGIIPDWPRAA